LQEYRILVAMKMKIFGGLLFACLLLAANFVNAQHVSSWKEMDAFHDVMSETFHPSEEGDLKPIRSRIDEMVTKAKAWQKSAVPEKYDSKKAKPRLKELVKDSKALRKTIRKDGSDKEVTEQLSELHDSFHYIMEKCRK
jgi:hypothetical protein